MGNQEMLSAFAQDLGFANALAPKNAKAVFLETIERSKTLNQQQQEQLVEDIAIGRLALRHYSVYEIVPATGANKIKITDASRLRNVGIRSLNGAKIQDGFYFVPSCIVLKSGVALAATDAGQLATDFGNINVDPDLEHGELTVTVEGNTLVKELYATVFNTEGSDINLGTFMLDSSIVIPGNKIIKAELELGAAAVVTALTYIRFEMHGIAAMSV